MYLTELTTLNLSGNEFKVVPKLALQSLVNLRILSIRNNHLKVIKPYDFQRLPLQHLDLGDNTSPLHLDRRAFCGLEPTPSAPQPGVIEWHGIQSLILDYNGISSIDPCLADILWTLSTIRLSGNPLLCDCRVFGFRDGFTKVRLPGVQCAAPREYAGLFIDDITSDHYNCTRSVAKQNECDGLCEHPLLSSVMSISHHMVCTWYFIIFYICG